MDIILMDKTRKNKSIPLLLMFDFVGSKHPPFDEAVIIESVKAADYCDNNQDYSDRKFHITFPCESGLQ
jgi:hypothetical protein